MIRRISLIFGIVLCAVLMSGCYIPALCSSSTIEDSRFSDLYGQEVILERPLIIRNGVAPDKLSGDEAFGRLPFYTSIYNGKENIITDFPELKKGYYVLEAGTKIRIKDCQRSIDYVLMLLPVNHQFQVNFTVPDDVIMKDQKYEYIWGGLCTLQRAPWEGEEVPKRRFINPFIK